MQLRTHRSQGFTLLEVLVGFSIAAAAALVLLQIFTGGLKLANKTEDYSRASILAESLLAQVGYVFLSEDMPINGVFDNKFNWQITTAPYHDVEVPQLDTRKTSLVELNIKVDWLEGTDVRRYDLSSLSMIPLEQN